MGSVLCLRVLQHLPEGHVSVHDARSAVPRPAWLTGTPTLVTDDGAVLRGHEALDHLQHVSVEMARAAAARPTRPPPTRTMMAPAPVGLVAEKRRPQQPAEAEETVVDDEVSALFASRLDAGDDLGDGQEERKITGDDLARALRERDAVAPPPPSANAPPPPPPQMSD